jgi:hypothetical protein
MVSAMLNTAAHSGDRKLFEKFRAAAVASKDPMEQQALLSAMGGFAQPEIATTALEELTQNRRDLTAPTNILVAILAGC